MTTATTSDPAGSDPASFDKNRAKAFLTQMVSVMNGGAMALMCSLGHRTGLFDAMNGMEPSTPAEIAAAAGLSERPVREWLNAVTVGGIVVHDPERGTYQLPREHAGLLTRAAGVLNLSNGLQFIGQMGKVEDEVVESFRTGKGVPYTSYDSFHRLMAEISTQRFETGLLDNVIPQVPGLADGLAAGIDFADIGCGSGHAINILGREFPHSRFHGYDISQEATDRGRTEAADWGLSNVTFHTIDAAQLNEADRFDMMSSFDAIHDQPRPDPVFAAIFNALRPGGRYLCVEPNASTHVHDNTSRTHAPFLYSVSTMHCMQVSLAAPDGEGVGAAWGREEIQRRLEAAGFTNLERANAPHDRTNDYWLSVKP